ncbi:hypothetical protein Ddye_022063 [Dipteronia dyeriana]|uniref:F-box domain-containing protein n=1 Tax=Dipteronia dyeriana TaxID=168575 RepID=A0AAD9U3K6_9ROSI|nr:hypothetical protein Ddye_022063 [Dipteronia dyeriana]
MEMESKNQRNLHIPEDIIINILRRLPPKSLARFKCVCKSWQSFANQHKYYNNKLILFSRNTIQSIDFEAAEEIKVVDLDIPFKIVRLMRFVDDNERPVRPRYSAEIYSQNSNSWQQKEILPWQIYRFLGYPQFSDSYFGVLVNEALYWKIRYISNDKEIHAVLLFDTLNEKFDVILSPDNVCIHKIGVFKGHLCIVEDPKTDCIDIWTREVDKNQNWIKFMNLPPFERKSHFDELAPICSMKNDEILALVREMNLNFLERWMKKEFLLYSPDVKTYKKIHISGTVKNFIDEITYTESFISP